MTHVKVYLDYGIIHTASYDDLELLANQTGKTFRLAYAAPKLGSRSNVIRLLPVQAETRDDAKRAVQTEFAKNGHTVEILASPDFLRRS